MSPEVPPNSSTTERLVRASLAQVAQDAVDGHALVDARDRADHVRERFAGPAAHQPPHEILRVQHADDVVDRIAIDRQAGIRALRDEPDHVVQRRRDVDRGDLGPRDHQLLRLPEVQAKRAAQAAMLVGFEESAVAALRDQQLDLFRRVNVTMRLGRRADETPQHEAGAVEPRDERPVDPQRRRHREDRIERRLRRVLKRQRLGNELREDHLRDGEQQQNDDDGRGLGGARLQARAREQRAQRAGDARLRRTRRARARTP